MFQGHDISAIALSSFVQIAPVEELAKLGAALLLVWKSPQFNEENDGVVYVGASAVGFALLENVMFVTENGMGTGILRAFTAIPLHVFTGVVMGLHVGKARFAESSADRTSLLGRGFLFAWFFHGLYDTLALSRSGLGLLLLPLVAGLGAFGILTLRKGRRLSLLRWGTRDKAPATAPTVAAQGGGAADLEPPAQLLDPASHAARRHAHRWVPVVGRIVLAVSGLFWALLLIGLLQPSLRGEVGAGILGGVLLTFIPIGLGVLLEVHWHRHGPRAAASGQATDA
jgi:hypothetical protein